MPPCQPGCWRGDRAGVTLGAVAIAATVAGYVLEGLLATSADLARAQRALTMAVLRARDVLVDHPSALPLAAQTLLVAGRVASGGRRLLRRDPR